MGGQRRHALRPDGGGGVGARPVGGGAGVQRRVQIVTEGGRQGGLIALGRRHLVQRGGVVALAGDQQLRQSARLGLQTTQTVLRGAGMCAGLGLDARQIAARGLGGLDGFAGGGQLGLCRFQRRAGDGQFRRLDGAQRLALAPGLIVLAGDAGQTGLGVALPRAFGVGAGFDGSQGPGQTLDLGVGGLARILGDQQRLLKLRPAFGRGGDLGLQLRQFVVQPVQFALGVGGHAFFALDVGVDAGRLGLEPVNLGAGGLFGHVEAVAFQRGPVQQGAGHGVFFARRLHRLLRLQGLGLGLGRCGAGLGHCAVGVAKFLGRDFRRRLGVVPAHVEQGGLQGADLGRDLLVFLGLTRFALQPVQGGFQFPPDVVQPVQIGLGGFQAQFGLVTAGVQTGHAASLFQNPAAVLRLGGDQFGNLALTHQGRAVGPGRGVGEQQLDVAGADLLAVDAIGRALTPVDAARHLQHRAVGKGLGRALLGVVDGQDDFGVAARRTARGAGEDDVVHALAAHGLGRVGAHDPAQAFQHVGLAAAVRPDHPGQAGLDLNFRRVDEGFEADELQSLELHRRGLSAP
ncbi:hypothetical protein D3C80_819900 [compost metagenome]